MMLNILRYQNTLKISSLYRNHINRTMHILKLHLGGLNKGGEVGKILRGEINLKGL